MNKPTSGSEADGGGDLRYAPPAFTNDAGQNVIFVDFVEANYELVIDAATRSASVDTTIQFVSGATGFPVVALRQPATSVQLDGGPAELQDQEAPDGRASFKIVTQPVSPGRHELKIRSTIVDDGPRGTPFRWLSNPDRFHGIFNMSDLRQDGGFLEAYMPSNYEYDHFQMTFTVKVVNPAVDYSVFSNGNVVDTAAGEWRIEFPPFYTTSCPWLHLGPANEFEQLRSEFTSSDGRTLPILVYARARLAQDEVDLARFRDLTSTVLLDLGKRLRSFPP